MFGNVVWSPPYVLAAAILLYCMVTIVKNQSERERLFLAGIALGSMAFLLGLAWLAFIFAGVGIAGLVLMRLRQRPNV
jgi:hypothetical protein